MTTNLFDCQPAWAGLHADVDTKRVPKIAEGFVRFGIRFECLPLVTAGSKCRFYIALAAAPTASRVLNPAEYDQLLESLVGENEAAENPVRHESQVPDLSIRPAW